MINLLQDQNTFHETLLNEKMVLVDFSADWCEPCKWLDVILNDLEPELNDFCFILKIDTERFIELSASFSVKSVPVLILFKDGVEVWRMNGFMMGPDLVAKIRSFAD